MKIDVRVAPTETQKFVLAQGKVNGEGVTLLWGNPVIEWHKDIVNEMLSAKISNVQVIGGGKIKYIPDKKAVYIWGKSTRYGDVPTETVLLVLREYFPDYSYFFKDPSAE